MRTTSAGRAPYWPPSASPRSPRCSCARTAGSPRARVREARAWDHGSAVLERVQRDRLGDDQAPVQARVLDLDDVAVTQPELLVHAERLLPVRGEVEVVRPGERQVLDVGDEVPDPAQDRHGLVALGPGRDAEPGLVEVPGRGQQRRLEVLAEGADRLPLRVGHVVRRGQVEALAGLEGEQRVLLAVVGVDGHLLLEGHALLLREGDQFALGPVRALHVHFVLVDHQPDALPDEQARRGLKSLEVHQVSVLRGRRMAAKTTRTVRTSLVGRVSRWTRARRTCRRSCAPDPSRSAWGRATAWVSASGWAWAWSCAGHPVRARRRRGARATRASYAVRAGAVLPRAGWSGRVRWRPRRAVARTSDGPGPEGAAGSPPGPGRA